jgi:asparagine synthase (glutamine-hydrolysing)
MAARDPTRVVIAGLVSRHHDDTAVGSIRTLSLTLAGSVTTWRSEGEPAVWLAGTDFLSTPADTRPAGAPGRRSAPVVAFDGRLHHVRDVRPGAGPAPAGARRNPAAVIAELYPGAGEALLDHVVGDFAFALWDPDARELMLATDPMGLWPLHYALSPDRSTLAFASHTSTLRALDWVGSDVDDETVVAHLLDLPRDAGRSFFRNIRLLPSGHRLRWRDGEIDVTRYWGPRFAPSGVGSVDEMLEAFQRTFRTAVAERLDPAAPTAILMSGGYDSTAVAGAAAALRRETPAAVPALAAISATFGDLSCDESSRIDIALAANGLPGHRACPLGRGITVDSMRRNVVRHDAPFVNFQAPFAADYTAIARDLGVTTLMTGLGGDELTIDFDYQIDFARTMGARRFLTTVCRVAGIEHRSRWSTAICLTRQLCPDPIKAPYRALRRPGRRRDRERAEGWLQPHAQRVAAELRARPPAPPVGLGSHTQEVRWRTIGHPAAEFARRWFAVETAASGFDLACPLLDRRLFELVFGTDPRWLPRSSDRGEYKPLIARGLRAYAPQELVGGYWKVGFESYNQHVMRLSLDAIESWLFDAPVWKAERFVSRGSAMQALRDCRDAPERSMFRFEAIIGLETWLREL